MKKLLIFFLMAVIVCGLIPQSYTAEAQEPDPAVPTSVAPARTCLIKLWRVGYNIDNVLKVRHYQKIRWCFNGEKIYTNWKLTTGWDIYSASWGLDTSYTPIVKGSTRSMTFEKSYLFSGYEYGDLYYLGSTIWQRVTRRGNYQVLDNHQLWEG